MAIAKWWKVDFHTHTPASNCFRKKEITPREWVEAAISAGLNAVVVTDHNSVGWIDELRKARDEVKQEDRNKNLCIYPGVELCVGNSFVHILIIFNPDIEFSKVEYFLMRCELGREDWANTEKRVKEDVLAGLIREYKKDLLVIPAHFNKNKGLCKELNQNGIREFVSSISIDAIEVRDEEDQREVENKISSGIIPRVATITGSDNPGNHEGEHDIIKFGKVYTWVKMSEPSIEGLRQAFLDPKTRVIKVIGAEEVNDCNPNNVTQNYIAGLKIKDLKHVNELDFRLSPHLNCIIGPRGSGKSTIVESVRLALRKYEELKTYPLIVNTYEDRSTIDLYYNFGVTKEYKINVSGKKGKQKWVYYDDNGVIEEYPEFSAAIFSQKEIFSLVEDDNDPEKVDKSPIIKIIDENIATDKIHILDKLNSTKQGIVNMAQQLNIIRGQIKDIPKIKAEIEVANSRLDIFKSSGIIEKRDRVNALTQTYSVLNDSIDNIRVLIDEVSSSMVKKCDAYTNDIKDLKLKEDLSICDEILCGIEKIKENMSTSSSMNKVITEGLLSILQNSGLKSELENVKTEYDELLNKVKGIDIENYKTIEKKNAEQVSKLNNLVKMKDTENEIVSTIKSKIRQYVDECEELTKKRGEIVSRINLNAANINLSIHLMSHGNRWLYNIRKELGKKDNFDDLFTMIYSKIFTDGIINKEGLISWFEFILTTDSGDIKDFLGIDAIDARFEAIWTSKFNEGTLSSLFNFTPEDRVEIRIINDDQIMNINEGSPGQKSAAILAFILNQGTQPLIIDQPEDDLDNSLIIELIVENIRKLKNSRQIIIITHNPNIPVLGDAEGIIMLDRDVQGKVVFKSSKKTGCIEEKTIKKGICDIMEGGIEAFKKRENKYRFVAQ